MGETNITTDPTCFTSDRAANMPESSTVRVADLATRLRAEGRQIFDLSAGRASEPTDAEICEAAIEAFRDGDTHQTPARGQHAYLQAISAKLHRENSLNYDADTEVMATLGCKNGLTIALAAIIDPGDEVLVEDPCFVSYAPTIRLLGGVPVSVPLDPGNRWRMRPDALHSTVTAKTKAAIICSPGNPTGTVHSSEDMKPLAELARACGFVIIADEIYEAVTWSGNKHTPIASLPGMREHVIGLMGLTKSYSMGGWRIGYAYAPAPLIERMTMAQAHIMTCASSIGQRAATKALSESVTNRLRHSVWGDWAKRCHRLPTYLAAHSPLKVKPPEGGFYAWADISFSGLSSDQFAQHLLEREGVAVVPGGSFGASTDHYVRLTCVKSDAEIDEAAERIVRFCETL